MEMIASFLRLPLEIMFFTGLAGSLVVLLLSTIDDIETLLGRDE